MPNSIKGRSLVILLLVFLFGCAAQKLNKDGQALLDEGRYEEGLQKLQEAIKADPGDVSFRTALVRNRDLIVNQLLAEADGARNAGRFETAEAKYRRVLGIAPENRRATDGLELLDMDRRHEKNISAAQDLLKKGDLDAAEAQIHKVLLENPQNAQAQALLRQVDDLVAKEQLSSPSLKAQFKKPVTLQFRDANLKMVFEALSRVAGINILLDKDVRPDLKVSIFVKDVSVEDTIDLILLQSQLEKKIISDNTVFVYPNTPAKIKDYQELMIRSFHLTNADPKQMLTMLKTVLKTKDIFINEKTNSIVMRDTPDAVRLAEKMIADQDIAEPEVMMEVEVLEVNRSRLTDLGINWPNQLTLTALGTGTVPGAATPTATPTLTQLRHINSDNIVTSPPLSVTLKALLQDSDTDILASPRIRARNREKAKIMIGDRVPVITNAVTPVATGAPVVTGSVQYLDVGMKLEVEPDIHADDQVAIKINLDVSSIVQQIQNAASGTLAYQIGTRNASTLLQLKDGETQILAGLIDNEQRNTANKVPGLGQMPVLGKLFSENQGNGTKTEIILSITPHIIGKQKEPSALDLEYWSGTEATIHSKPVELRPAGKSAAITAPLQLPQNQSAPAAPAAAAPQIPEAQPVFAPPSFNWEGPKASRVGDKITISFNTASSNGLRNIGLTLNYDPQVLKATQVSEGNFMKRSNVRTKFTQSIDGEKGRIAVDLASPGAASGSGSIVTMQFDVIKKAAATEITASGINIAGVRGETLALAAPPPLAIAITQ